MRYTGICVVAACSWIGIQKYQVLHNAIQGPVVQSIVNLTSSLMVKMLTVLVSTISNSQVFLLEKKM